VKHYAVIGGIEAIYRADSSTRSVGTMHTGNGYRFLSGFTITQGYDATSVNTPGNFVLVFAGGYTPVTFDAAFSITQKFHSSHNYFPPA
jgi:hypothetical protein